MHTLQSMLVSTATLFLIFATLAHTQKFMHNGKLYDDKFYELFTEKAPVKDIIKLAVSWNADKQLDHFDQLYHHINSKDDSAEYAQSIVDATRAVLDQALKQVGYTKQMNLEQYLWSTYQVQNSMGSEVDPNILEGLNLLDKIDGDAFEKLLNAGAEEELEWELDNLHPYKMVPKKSDSASKSQETEVEGETLEPQQFAEKPVPETQESEESTPKSQASEDTVSEPQRSEEVVPEEQESEEILAEPPKSDDAVPNVQESEEAISEPQKSEQRSDNLVPEEQKPQEAVHQSQNSEETAEQ